MILKLVGPSMTFPNDLLTNMAYCMCICDNKMAFPCKTCIDSTLVISLGGSSLLSDPFISSQLVWSYISNQRRTEGDRIILWFQTRTLRTWDVALVTQFLVELGSDWGFCEPALILLPYLPNPFVTTMKTD